MSQNETGDPQHQHGQSVALLETPNGVTIIGNKPSNGNATTYNHDPENEVERRNLRHHDLEDDSFEYGTDRESSVYNPTTLPIRSVMAQAGGRNSQKNSESDSGNDQSDLLTKGNQLGIPESRFSRWIPKDQREILEKQAKIMAERMRPKTPEPKRIIESEPEETTPVKKQSPKTSRTNTNDTASAAVKPTNNVPTETEIYSDTESADVKATSTATTATTAAVSELDANSQVNNETGNSNSNNAGNKKSKRLPSFAAIFKRMNERDTTSNKRKNNEQDANNEGEGCLTSTATAQANEQLATNINTDGNDNQPKEDKQLVYAELVLKPAENNEPLPAKSSTEYAEIVYVKKDENPK